MLAILNRPNIVLIFGPDLILSTSILLTDVWESNDAHLQAGLEATKKRPLLLFLLLLWGHFSCLFLDQKEIRAVTTGFGREDLLHQSWRVQLQYLWSIRSCAPPVTIGMIALQPTKRKTTTRLIKNAQAKPSKMCRQ